MKIFVSYSRSDREAVDALLQDIRRARHDVWVDEELTGGQVWWDTILGAIQGADLFVVALSPDWLKSRACSAELEYARGCNRTLLPVMISRVSPQMAPPVIANAQILDYLERTPNAAINLVTALAAAPPSLPPPDPLPAPPDVPMSYMNTYRERLEELSLSFQQQSLLLSELRAHLTDDDDRDTAAELIRRLRRRGDITESVGKEIDLVLAALPSQTASFAAPGSSPTPSPTPMPTPATTPTPTPASTVRPLVNTGQTASPAAWHPDPYRRFEQRYWDGTTWTEHVISGDRRSVDPPGGQIPNHQAPGNQAPSYQVPSYQMSNANTAPTSTGSAGSTVDGPWNMTNFVLLIIASTCLGIVGVVVGAINLKKPRRQSQAKILLIVGIVSMVFGALVAAGQ